MKTKNKDAINNMKLGKVSENCLKRSVLRQIHPVRKELVCGAGVGEDCAIFSFPTEDFPTEIFPAETFPTEVFSAEKVSAGKLVASCVQEAAVAAGEISGGGPEPVLTLAQLIQKGANNLAAGGAEPLAAVIALLLPEHAEEKDIKALMAEAQEKCEELDLQIAGGQTRVSGAVTMPVATVTVFGRADHRFCGGKASPGQDVVVSKWIGLQGTAILARRFRDKLFARYPAYLIDEAAGFDRYLSIIPEAATAMKSGVCAMHDVSEGGIFGALWELAERAGVGLTIDMKKLPLRQETVEVCECCNVNPYTLLSGGSLLMTAEDGQGLAAALAAEHIPAVVVGKVTDSRDRLLINGEEVRYLDRPQGDEIYSISSVMR